MSKTITIDPKMFINKPYIICPECGKKQFGVLMINRRSYVRRCANCRYDKTFSLPDITKKLIYIDQFAISEMMKSLNPSDRANKRVDPYWLKVFEKLDRLVKLQLIVCPESFTHHDESIVAGDRYRPLRRIYELLSHGVSFYDDSTIKRFQTHHALLEWIGTPRAEDLTVHDVVHQDINKWQSRFLVSVDVYGDDIEKVAEQIRKDRESVSSGLQEVCEYWKTEKNVTFKEFYERERSIFGESILREYARSIQKMIAMQMGIEDMDIGVFMSSNSVLMTQIHGDLEKQGVKQSDTMAKTAEFLRSQQIKEIPYLKISAMMFAALARQFSVGGRVKSLSKGMMNDITTIASLALYCDAMFMDKECETIVAQNESKVGLQFSEKIFSLNKKQEFLGYLDQIEKEAGPEHLKLVEKVYGKDWGKPYIEVFQKKT